MTTWPRPASEALLGFWHMLADLRSRPNLHWGVSPYSLHELLLSNWRTLEGLYGPLLEADGAEVPDLLKDVLGKRNLDGSLLFRIHAATADLLDLVGIAWERFLARLLDRKLVELPPPEYHPPLEWLVEDGCRVLDLLESGKVVSRKYFPPLDPGIELHRALLEQTEASRRALGAERPAPPPEPEPRREPPPGPHPPSFDDLQTPYADDPESGGFAPLESAAVQGLWLTDADLERLHEVGSPRHMAAAGLSRGRCEPILRAAVSRREDPVVWSALALWLLRESSSDLERFLRDAAEEMRPFPLQLPLFADAANHRRMQVAARLRTLDPQNGAADLLLGYSLARAGFQDLALDAYEQAGLKPRLDCWGDALRWALVEAAEAVGYSAYSARLLALGVANGFMLLTPLVNLLDSGIPARPGHAEVGRHWGQSRLILDVLVGERVLESCGLPTSRAAACQEALHRLHLLERMPIPEWRWVRYLDEVLGDSEVEAIARLDAEFGT